MKTIHKTAKSESNPYISRYFTETCAFFDIETTGFSAKTSFVYLIGLAVRKNDTLHIYQFLAENRNDEADVLCAFHAQLAADSVQTLITFNGIGFDVPFLKQRESLCNISENWETYDFLDLYKVTSKLTKFLTLPDKKQKSLERFLGIDRNDKYNGGELISVYYTYEKEHDTESETLLLLHNYEDVLGMTKLLPVLSYYEISGENVSVFDFTVSDASLHNYLPYGAFNTEKEFLLSLTTALPFPKSVQYQTELFSLLCEKNNIHFSVPVINGELKFFYSNYKDYYYLPDEDTAVHKSVAAFVDKAHKKKATASTCYTKRQGLFLPQKEELFAPVFKRDKKDKICYFEVTEEFLTDTEKLKVYAEHLLSQKS